ncbi:MAG: Na+/H+ antiporter subunit E [Desulfobacterales bacterium]|nr:Na+/H+ antiporter subunit E [Desulfobacterales bacterium]
MNLFMLNLFLALGFSAVRGQFTLSGLLTGFLVGYLALWISKPLYPDAAYFVRVPRILHLAGYFLYQLIVSNFRVMWEVITPRPSSRPGIIGIELAARTDMEIMLVANMISLTPGTLSLDISDDRRVLYVHFMFLDDPALARHEIKDGLERRVLEALR